MDISIAPSASHDNKINQLISTDGHLLAAPTQILSAQPILVHFARFDVHCAGNWCPSA
ncbi:hypothetical protein ACN2XU_23305 [Primorskyibacter sp. 2E107]